MSKKQTDLDCRKLLHIKNNTQAQSRSVSEKQVKIDKYPFINCKALKNKLNLYSNY